MSFISIVDTDLQYIGKWLQTVEEELITIIKAIITAEQQEIVTTIMPLFKQAAVTLQNESPGLNAASFIPALVAVVIPILPEALKDLEVTAISTFASVIAGQLNVPNQSGNAGNLPGGTDSTGNVSAT